MSLLILFQPPPGPVTHAATGALVGQGADLDGTAKHNVPHPSSGAIAGAGSDLDGAANRFRAHSSSGTLAGQGADLDGAATRFRAHASSGTLAGGGSVIVGASNRFRSHPSSGALVGAGSDVDGSANRFRAHPTTGAIVGPGADLDGAAERASGSVTHDTSGALAGAGAELAGASARTSPAPVSVGGSTRKKGKGKSGKGFFYPANFVLQEHLLGVQNPRVLLKAHGTGVVVVSGAARSMRGTTLRTVGRVELVGRAIPRRATACRATGDTVMPEDELELMLALLASE